MATKFRCGRLNSAARFFLSIIMTIPFAALKAQKGMKPECRNAEFKDLC